MNATDTSTTPILVRAEQAMGIGALDEVLDEVRQRQIAADTRPGTGARLNTLANKIVTDATIPDDLAEQAAAIADADRAAAVERDILTGVRRQLERRAEQDRINRVDLGLDVLRGRLDEILAEARLVFTDLDGVGDAESAIDANVTEQWRAATRLARDYDEIRTAQIVLLTGALGRRDGLIDDTPGEIARRAVTAVGTIRDLGPSQVIKAGNYLRRRQRDFDPVDAWGRPIPQSAIIFPWSGPVPVENLRYAVRDGVTAWVPTLAELRAAIAAATLGTVDPTPAPEPTGPRPAGVITVLG